MTRLVGGFEPEIALEANDCQEAQAMVATGIGVAMALRLTAVDRRSDVRAIPLDRPAPTRRVLVARLRERPPSPAGTAFVGCLKPGAAGL